MKKKLYLLFAFSLFVPATPASVEAQVVYPLPPPNALVVIPGDPCEGCILNVCNCTINGPIIINAS